MLVLLVGDTHGNGFAIDMAVEHAQKHGIKRIVQLGDFGIWPGPKGEYFLDGVECSLKDTGITLHFIDGNHEDFDQIEAMVEAGSPNEDGHYEFRPNLFYIPRGTYWTWAGKKWLAMGGAYSVDKSMRVEGKSWWPQETPTYAQLSKAVDNVAGGVVDYLLTHDAMAETQWPRPLLPIPASLAVRNDISGLVKAVKPKMMFHGHYHFNVNWVYRADDWTTEVHGLDSDANPGSMGLLDTNDNTYTSIRRIY